MRLLYSGVLVFEHQPENKFGTFEVGYDARLRGFYVTACMTHEGRRSTVEHTGLLTLAKAFEELERFRLAAEKSDPIPF